MFSRGWFKRRLPYIGQLLTGPGQPGTSGTLDTQSAHWANPEPTPQQAQSLTTQSSEWAAGSISQSFVATLSSDSATWAAGELAVPNGNTLTTQSATWAAGTLSQAFTATLTTESATWANPAPEANQTQPLASQSAGWSAGSIEPASAASLAADSASWAIGTLDTSQTQPLATATAAWSAGELVTPGGGPSATLATASAQWQPGTLTPLFISAGWGLPLSFSFEPLAFLAGVDCSLEFQFMSNTEQVTLYRKLTDGTFDAGTVIVNALRLNVEKDLTGGGRGLVRKHHLDWYVWSVQCGLPPVKVNDVIQDAAGVRWTIWNVDVQAWGARFLVQTLQEA